MTEQLAAHQVAIVFCNADYVQAAQIDATIPKALEQFAFGKKDALHTLQCVDFKSASKVVASHYLFRNYQQIINITHDSLLPLATFVDLLGKYSGKQGLGLLPDLLDLEHNVQNEARRAYEVIFDELDRTLIDLTLTYRLRKHLEENHANHPFQLYLQTALLVQPLEEKHNSPSPVVIQLAVVTPAKAGAHPHDGSQFMDGSPPSRGRQVVNLGVTEKLHNAVRNLLYNPEAKAKIFLC